MTGGLGEVFHFTVESPGRTPAELLELVELRVAPILRAAEGVVEVNTWGGARRTLEVRADPMRMARAGVTLAAARALDPAVGTVPGGALSAGRDAGAAARRAAHHPRGPGDLSVAVVRFRGEPVRVGDVADVAWAPLPRLGRPPPTAAARPST
jgi:cobalt-zinc-cadmium resistance protein CzcA